MKHAYFIPNIQYRTMKKVDPLRVSQSISKNMMKDLNKDAYGNKEAPMDIKLANRDQEILIGNDNDGDVPVEKETKVKNHESLHTIDKNEIVDIKENKKDGAILQDKKAGAKV